MSEFPSMSKVFKLPKGTKVTPRPDIGEGAEEFVAPPGYKAYHGTSSKNVESILNRGLDAVGAGIREPGPYSTVCFTEDPHVCEDYGDAVIEADLSGMTVVRFFDEGEEDGVWEVQVDGTVPPDRLKIWEG